MSDETTVTPEVVTEETVEVEAPAVEITEEVAPEATEEVVA